MTDPVSPLETGIMASRMSSGFMMTSQLLRTGRPISHLAW